MSASDVLIWSMVLFAATIMLSITVAVAVVTYRTLRGDIDQR